jgi:hypothetical protein
VFDSCPKINFESIQFMPCCFERELIISIDSISINYKLKKDSFLGILEVTDEMSNVRRDKQSTECPEKLD